MDYSPLTCEPGTWSGSPSFTYTFQVEDASSRVLQSGPSNVYAPPASLIDFPLVCIVQASNAGGVTTFRSATSPPIAADTARPASSLSGPKCHLQACILSIAASDPNSVPLGVSLAGQLCGEREVLPSKKGHRKGRHGSPALCKRTVDVPLDLTDTSRGPLPRERRHGCHTTSASRSPRWSPTRPGCARAKPLTRSATLHPPSKSARGQVPARRAIGAEGGRRPAPAQARAGTRTIALAPVSAADPISFARTASYEADPAEVSRVLLLYSGGLDTSVMLKWIQDSYDAEVVCLTVNLGQPGEDYEVIKGKALELGALECHVVDAREEFAREYIAPAIRANALYGGDTRCSRRSAGR